MQRTAILLINSAKSSNPSTNVDKNRAKYHGREIATKLNNLGEYSFTVNGIVDESHIEAEKKIKGVLSSLQKKWTDEKENCLLFYYFGHARDREMQDGRHSLHFFFNDSDENVKSTLISFDEIAQTVFGYGISNVVFILDCCYAGAALLSFSRNLNSASKYFVLCSAIPTQKANIRSGKSPFGFFSLTLFDGFTDDQAISPVSGFTTPKTLFTYTDDMFKSANFGKGIEFAQAPFFIDGGLADFPLMKPNIRKLIKPSSNIDAAIKSYYSKYLWIGKGVFDKGSISIDDLYIAAKKDKVAQFLTPVKKGDATFYETVTQITFETYINGMVTLGILLKGDPLKLSPKGELMFRSNQNKYNEVLLDLIENILNNGGLTLDNLDFLLISKMRSKRITSAPALYQDAKNRFNINIGSSLFSIILDLLSYIGFIRSTTKKTYYPYY
jgi:hypothetical protein